MRIVLLNENPAVSRLIGISLSKLGYDFSEVQSIQNTDSYDIFIVDSSVINQNLDVKFDDRSTIFLVPRNSNEYVDKIYKLEKPFLPMEFIELFEKIQNNNNLNNVDSLEDTDIIDIQNIQYSFETFDQNDLSFENEKNDLDGDKFFEIGHMDDALDKKSEDKIKVEENQFSELSDMLKEIDEMEIDSKDDDFDLNLEESSKSFEIIQEDEENEHIETIQDDFDSVIDMSQGAKDLDTVQCDINSGDDMNLDIDELNERDIKIALDEDIESSLDDLSEKIVDESVGENENSDKESLQNELQNEISNVIIESLNGNDKIKDVLKNMKININISFEDK